MVLCNTSSANKNSILTDAERLEIRTLTRSFMTELGFSSIFKLAVEGDIPPASMYRWMEHKTALTMDSARRLVAALQIISSYRQSGESPAIAAMLAILDCRAAEDPRITRLRIELRARRVPVGAVLDALQAAKIIS